MSEATKEAVVQEPAPAKFQERDRAVFDGRVVTVIGRALRDTAEGVEYCYVLAPVGGAWNPSHTGFVAEARLLTPAEHRAQVEAQLKEPR